MSRKKYMLAVYGGLGLTAVIIGLIGLNYVNDENPLQAVLLGFATEFGSVVFVFFLVDWFFRVHSDDALVSEVKSLRSLIERQNYPLVWGQQSNSRFDVTTVFSGAESIRLAGRNLTSLLKDSEGYLLSAIKSGANIQIVLTEVDGIIEDYIGEHVDKPEVYKGLSEIGIDYARKLQRQSTYLGSRRTVETRLTKLVLGYSFVLIEYGNEKTGVAKISLYPTTFGHQDSDRRALILEESSDSKNYRYFSEQYDELWKKGTFACAIVF